MWLHSFTQVDKSIVFLFLGFTLYFSHLPPPFYQNAAMLSLQCMSNYHWENNKVCACVCSKFFRCISDAIWHSYPLSNTYIHRNNLFQLKLVSVKAHLRSLFHYYSYLNYTFCLQLYRIQIHDDQSSHEPTMSLLMKTNLKKC